jgi:hypothetical protein
MKSKFDFDLGTKEKLCTKTNNLRHSLVGFGAVVATPELQPEIPHYRLSFFSEQDQTIEQRRPFRETIIAEGKYRQGPLGSEARRVIMMFFRYQGQLLE